MSHANRKKAASFGEAFQEGIKQMDTEDTVGLVFGVVCSVVFFGAGTVAIWGVGLDTQIAGYTLFGSAVTWALAGALGGAVVQLVTNYLRVDDWSFDAMQMWGTAFAIGPTVITFWNADFKNWILSDPAIGSVFVVVAAVGYTFLAAAPTLRMDN